MKRFKYLFPAFVFSISLVFLNVPVSFAQENVQNLKAQIEALQKRVDELEQAQQQNQNEEDSWGYAPSQQGSSGGFGFWDDWDPFARMQRMQEEMNNMLQGYSRSMPQQGQAAVLRPNFYEENFELKEEGDHYIIEFDTTGLDQNKVDIAINAHSLTISAEQSSETKENNANSSFHSKSYGKFVKTVPLPMDADTAKLETKKENNKLIITIPKIKG